ncbi:hypothetical protein BDV40DRAFT_262681 [Aspergillus tamarii]|uniref:Uncharacterized protein n=1 Tax=Aspergillus tamarii TaxID=41984 RepID=A0A5N6UY52_ASPTM|nr:hypothetical protein BDV40DRAFT_262681 [Aspergillus tamarii]
MVVPLNEHTPVSQCGEAALETSSSPQITYCKTALQIHWDWAWTWQDVVIESCGTGIVVTGGVSAHKLTPPKLFCVSNPRL